MIYDPRTTGLLSDAAKAESDIVSLAELAEDLLGLSGSDFKGAQGSTAARAVALQVNHQVELGPEGFALIADKTGDRARQFGKDIVSPMAAQLVSGLYAEQSSIGKDWASFRSFRADGR